MPPRFWFAKSASAVPAVTEGLTLPSAVNAAPGEPPPPYLSYHEPAPPSIVLAALIDAPVLAAFPVRRATCAAYSIFRADSSPSNRDASAPISPSPSRLAIRLTTVGSLAPAPEAAATACARDCAYRAERRRCTASS